MQYLDFLPFSRFILFLSQLGWDDPLLILKMENEMSTTMTEEYR